MSLAHQSNGSETIKAVSAVYQFAVTKETLLRHNKTHGTASRAADTYSCAQSITPFSFRSFSPAPILWKQKGKNQLDMEQSP